MSKIGNVKVTPMRFWAQKVLPLVYDESISYYEVLDKTVQKLNELIEVMNDKLDEYVRARIDELFINATYDEATETIFLTMEEVSNER